MQKYKKIKNGTADEIGKKHQEELSDFFLIAAFSENQLRRKMKDSLNLNCDKKEDFEKLKPLGCCVYSLTEESEKLKTILLLQKKEKEKIQNEL